MFILQDLKRNYVNVRIFSVNSRWWWTLVKHIFEEQKSRSPSPTAIELKRKSPKQAVKMASAMEQNKQQFIFVKPDHIIDIDATSYRELRGWSVPPASTLQNLVSFSASDWGSATELSSLINMGGK